MNVRRGQVNRDHLEDVCVRYRRVVEAGSVDKSDEFPVQLECVSRFDLGRAGLETLADREVGVAQKVDELPEVQ